MSGPRRVFRFKTPKCPYCGGDLKARVTGWVWQESGWAAVELEVDCSSEPPIDDPAWEDWLEAHTYMPYAIWHPVTERLLRWINGRYKFNCGAA